MSQVCTKGISKGNHAKRNTDNNMKNIILTLIALTTLANAESCCNALPHGGYGFDPAPIMQAKDVQEIQKHVADTIAFVKENKVKDSVAFRVWIRIVERELKTSGIKL